MGGYEFVHNGKAFTPDGDPPVETSKEESDERNRALANAEIEAFKARSHDRWFGYWKDCGWGPSVIITWTGERLANVTWKGAEYKSPAFGGFPSKRINFRAIGIDGRLWAGTYYKSSGCYVRMRVVKGK